MGMTPQEIHAKLQQRFGDAILEFNETVLQPYIKVSPERLDTIAEYLRDSDLMAFDYLSCLSGVDAVPNLAVIYHLYSLKHNHKIVLRVEVTREQPGVKSVAQLWRTADWHEREAYDMYGLQFIGHPDLRRILLPDDWEGFPLRKDYVTPEFYNGLRIPYPQEKEASRE
jgi:NADH-quinone oxidoreductase subunit C